MRRGIEILAIGLAVCSASHQAGAQQVRGMVRDSTAGAALPGAVVSLVDSAGKLLRRTIADAGGRFSLAFTPNAAGLHVIRIGYRPRDAAVSMASIASELNLVMSRIPPMLEAVHVSDRELCPGSADRGPAFQLWEQARAGLLAAVVARESNPAKATTLTFARTLVPSDSLVKRQTVEVRSGRTTRPFIAAADPATFVRRGYMQEDSAGRIFSAPDADVLLDESFATTHCFHLQAGDATHVDQIGLAFSPVYGRDALVDVTGVIWVDRQTPALRSLEFLFTGLEPAATQAGVGGHLEFRTVANGVAFIERWALRMPILQQTVRRPGGASSTPVDTRRQDRNDFRVANIQEAGGEVLQATWADGTSWREEPTGVTGIVTQRNTGRPIPFAMITVAGTSDTVTANERGEFALVPLIQGRYTIIAVDTTLRAYADERTDSRVVQVQRGHVTTFQPQLAQIADVLAEACRGQRSPRNTTTLVGRVTMPDGTPPKNTELRATWLSEINNGQPLNVASGAVSVSSGDQRVEPDSHGRFIICGIALERPVHLKLSQRSLSADTTVTVFDSTFKSIDWTTDLRSAASVVAASVPRPADNRSMVSSRARAIEERRRAHPLAFVDDSVLRRNERGRLGDVLRGRMSGLNIQSGAGATYAVSSRDLRTGMLSGSDAARQPCYSTIYLDGALVFELNAVGTKEPPNLNDFSVDQIAAVEFYSAGASAPAQFNSGLCGLVLVWTRER